MTDTKWSWWAGADEEYLTIGPCATKEEAIEEALSDIGEGEGDFIVLEAVIQEISLSASAILDNAYEHWSDCSDLFSMEHDAPEPRGSKEDQKAAETELQALLDAWVAKWRHTLPEPTVFAASRNQETIPNTADAA